MMKKLLFAAALLSLTLLGGCAKGGSGPCVVNCPSIQIEPNIGVVGLNVSVPLTLQFVNVSSSPVNWTIQPSSCGSACGTLSNVTTTSATYTGPSSIPSNSSITIVATSQSNSGLTGSLGVTIIPVTTAIAPVSPNVEAGLTQQFTAVALPDQAPQTFTWSCTVSGAPCANFSQSPSISGLATYQPTPGEECSSSGCVTISAIPTIDPTGCTVDPSVTCTPSQTTVVSSRVPSGQYAFQFSGYDGNGKTISLAGTFTVDSGGSISGYEDEWTTSGLAKRAFSGGSYSPISAGNVNSNNAGTLSLNTGAFPENYQVVLDAAGDMQMIASDGSGDSGSGVAEPAVPSKFNKGAGNPAIFAFGFTGVDSAGKRVGYAGLLPTDGVSLVTAGSIDVNDNGSASNSVCSTTPPCTVAGSYVADGTVSNLWHLTLTAPIAMTFDFFVANGNENNNSNNPLYLYAISTDSNPAMLGAMTYQNPKIAPYNNAALKGTSISALTGANGNVALVQGIADGTTDQNNFTGTFDWNNAGTITSVPPTNPCPPTGMPTVVCSFANTYVASMTNTGRYTVSMLGTPNASSPGPPIPFILYASGASRGFLLDSSSSAVITGTMNEQIPPKQNAGFFGSSSASGTYAVATYSNSAPSDSTCASTDSLLTACYVTMNLLLTSPGNSVFNVTGTENPGNQAFNQPYVVNGPGTGTIGPASGATTPNYHIYGVTETSFFMIDLDTDKNGPVVSPILFMEQ